MIEEAFKGVAGYVAMGCEGLAVVCVAVGALKTVVAGVPTLFRNAQGDYAIVWRDFAVWLALALEFALAADIADTVISPTWDDIGKLAAIAAIRTVLNLFLERDLDFVRAFLPRGIGPRSAVPTEEK